MQIVGCVCHQTILLRHSVKVHAKVTGKYNGGLTYKCDGMWQVFINIVLGEGEYHPLTFTLKPQIYALLLACKHC